MKQKPVTLKELEPFQSIGHDVKMNLGDSLAVTVNKNMLDRLIKGGVLTIEPTEAGFLQAHQKLMEAAGASGVGYIPVTKAGPGPTDKSRKVRVDEVVHLLSCVDWNRNPIFSEKGTHSHTLTVPASLLIEREGQLYAPRWMLNRTICERVFQKRKDRSDWSVTIKNGVFLDSEKVWNDFWVPLLAEASRIVEEEAQKVQKEQERYAAQAPQRELERQRDLERQASIKNSAQKKVDAYQKNLDKLETVGPVDVRYTEIKYVQRNANRTPMFVKGCTLKFSGSRVYIILPDGYSVIKSRKDIEWTPSKNNP